MSVPIIMYGRDDCDDTEAIRDYFNSQHIDFHEVNINEDRAAEQFVIFINDGLRRTPTLILGSGKQRTILIEPSPGEVESALKTHHA